MTNVMLKSFPIAMSTKEYKESQTWLKIQIAWIKLLFLSVSPPVLFFSQYTEVCII